MGGDICDYIKFNEKYELFIAFKTKISFFPSFHYYLNQPHNFTFSTRIFFILPPYISEAKFKQL